MAVKAPPAPSRWDVARKFGDSATEKTKQKNRYLKNDLQRISEKNCIFVFYVKINGKN
jgi:hypothetical protein